MREFQMKPDLANPVWYLAEESFDAGISPGEGRPAHYRSHVWRPPTDVYETEDEVVVRLEVAGMREGDFVITLQDRVLTVRGQRMEPSERRSYHRMEVRFGEFASQVLLPAPVLGDESKAEYRNGFLTIKLPKQKPHYIQITDL